MINWLRLPLATLALATLLGGCVAYPSGYGDGAPYYSAPYVGVGGGLHEDGGWRH